MNNVVVLLGRIFLAVLFILAGFGKLTDPGTQDAAFSTVGMIAGRGLPAPLVLAYLAGLVELLGGLAILVGFQTRIAAWALSIFTLATAFLFHFGATGDAMTDTINQIMFLKNFAIAGGFLVLGAYGAGALSVDARRGVAAYA
jgi:putative oxidoreductase